MIQCKIFIKSDKKCHRHLQSATTSYGDKTGFYIG